MRGADIRLLASKLQLMPSKLLLARFFTGRQRNFRQPATIHADPGILGQRITLGVRKRLVCTDAVLIATRDLVALLVGQELLNRIRLLWIGDVPVAYGFPGRVRVTAEYQLADCRGYF